MGQVEVKDHVEAQEKGPLVGADAALAEGYDHDSVVQRAKPHTEALG